MENKILKQIIKKMRKLKNAEIKDKQIVYPEYNEYCVAMQDAINIVKKIVKKEIK